ncbi:hypothetical protein EVAR_84678_1 [Eumeta japonica]|uniref:Uncharacterized protein n=1 Tax=Eumeta variegata TaxID=151549 RepID=A0A4C2A4A5_EUMVA|nr:hypothetical protein EVAR_84678_1 [Eumeta japonica]
MGERRKKLASIRIPRCISPGHTEGSYMFVDASEKSYAAAVLAYKIERTRKRSFANSRKSSRRPLKVISIPRLELKAALLSAQLSLYERQLSHYDARRAHNDLYVVRRPRAISRSIPWHRAKMKVPLTEVDVEPAEAEGLTPNHFLIGAPRRCRSGHFDDNVLHGLQTGARVSASPITSGRDSWVDVETTGGVLRRPTSKIVVLVSAEATAVPCPEVVLRTEGRMLRTAAQLI